jgi:hypothetical protein
MVLFLLATTLLGRLAVAPLRVSIAFGGHGTSAAVEQAALTEAAAVWAPYGVELRRADAGTADAGIVLRVVVTDHPAGAVLGHSLGSVAFHDGVPAPVINLYAATAGELVSATTNRESDRWPALYANAVLGRVLGRALAHEVGHYLLRERSHAGRGLMRAVQRGDDLMALDRRRLFLEPGEQQVLEQLAMSRDPCAQSSCSRGERSRSSSIRFDASAFESVSSKRSPVSRHNVSR